MPSATIKLFLVHGDPKRLRTAELSNWSGKAVAGPRSEFEDVLGREESLQAGVYFLTGRDPESGKYAIYIGEAESIIDRVKSHLAKDFWNHIVFFTSKDENLTKSHIRFLEGRLIEQAQKAKRCVVTNGQGSGSKLPESDREDMEVFLTKVYQLLPVLGVELLVPIVDATSKPNKEKQGLLHCSIKGLQARGYPVPNGFLVLKGSQAVVAERKSVDKWPWPKVMRDKLVEDGILSKQTDHWLFKENFEFASPSAAAAVIHGGHANGRISWKNADGKTLKELEEA